MSDLVQCPKCGGSLRCDACGGDGIQKEGVQIIPKSLRGLLAKCQLCKGSGECFTCKGKGQIKRSLAVRYSELGL